MITVAAVTMLIIISSCLTSASYHPDSREIRIVREVFPSAIDIAEIPFFISQDAHVSGRPDDAIISEIKDDSGLLGYCVESKVVSRSGPFRIRVLLDKRLHVKQATVISYSWDRGRDVCKRTFTTQFEGKGPEDPIQLGKDIDAITGATISCRVMAEGVRDTIKLLKLVKQKHLLLDYLTVSR
jgi:Na+-translocating ferredoxin:NAD+ oxidoreductase RnfG subunit